MLRKISMNIGYARVSTRDQTVALQVDALKEAGCEKVYTEVISGAATERPILAKATRRGTTGRHRGGLEAGSTGAFAQASG